jgi:peroxiredoxin
MEMSMANEVELNAVAPDFELPEFRGQPFRLSALRGSKHVLLVFNRGFV